ncbi:MAG: hypothetical protein KBC48_01135 [Candidatus Pacebacteria bacterium]|nr:hypothetical protein [Candidatus Paceibacterota bacterium]
MDGDLERIEAKVDENSRILKKLLLHNRWTSFVALVKWLLILGAAFGAYYYLQPYIDQITEVYKNVWGVLPR